jgi:hypothetical protein
MGKHRPRPIDASAAERLLAGGGGPEPVAKVLLRAAAPGTRGELSGEEAAVVAFRVARLYGHQTPQTAKAVTWGRRLLTVKAAAIGVAVLTAGGVALAAGTGVLPNPLEVGTPPGTSTSSSQTSLTSRTNGQSSSSSDTPGSASPSPSLEGLCSAYFGHIAANPGKAWDNPAFSTLVAAAGTAEDVESFCTQLLAGQPQPSGSARPTEHPTGPPSVKPTPKKT